MGGVQDAPQSKPATQVTVSLICPLLSGIGILPQEAAEEFQITGAKVADQAGAGGHRFGWLVACEL